jgi:hypothetical protein
MPTDSAPATIARLEKSEIGDRERRRERDAEIADAGWYAVA